MTDLTNNKINPVFHIKDFKDRVADAIFSREMVTGGRSSEYKEGYNFGIVLIKDRDTIVSQSN